MLVHIALVHTCIPSGGHLCRNSLKVSNISRGHEYWIWRYERTLLFKFQIFHAVVRLDMTL